MSYAEAAARGPKQSPEEARAPTPSTISKNEQEATASLIDVDSPHVTAVDSGFLDQDIKTTTQAERIAREQEAEQRTQEKKQKAKAKASKVSRNKGNPVFVGNAVILALVGAGLGFGAYKKHLDGQLSWPLVGLWTGAIGVFGAVDYFISKWFLQNKYPPK